ncbi:lipopolysaccharide biosynthesis protein [Pilimelia columellifera]|uniref:Polysaccharide biosynthesis protein n=1 Tax=Pilimelia columellifera subsp. columellifera TaxID=706583 RepID=A0ABP6AA32_9ACTN
MKPERPPSLQRSDPAPHAATAGQTALRLAAGHGTILVASLIVTTASAHALGPSGRGELTAALLITYIGAIVALGGTDRAYPVVMAHEPVTFGQARADLHRCAAPVTGALIASGVAINLVPAGPDSPARFGLVVAAAVAGGVLTTAVRTAAAATRRGGAYLVTTTATQGLLVAAALTLTFTGQDEPAVWLWAYAAAPIVVAAATWPFLRDRTRRPRSRQQLRDLRRNGRRLLPATLAAYATQRGDRLLIPVLASTETLGLYVVAASFAEICAIPVQNVVDAHLTTWRRQAKTGQLRIRRILGLALGYAVVAAVVVAVVGVWCVNRLFPPEFAVSAEVLPLLSVACAAWAFARVAAGLALVRRPPGQISQADVATAVLTAVGLLALAPPFGLWGAAGAVALGYGTNAVLMAWLATARVPIEESR